MITELSTALDFPDEAISHLQNCHDKLMSNPRLYSKLWEAVDLFYVDEDNSYRSKINQISQDSGIHPYTVEMILLLLAARPLRYIYKQKGISEEIYYDTLSDLKCKLFECKNVYGIWGTFVGWWYPKTIFSCRLFKLGRLEYERINFPYASYGNILKSGDTVYSCHIPSAGPLTPDTVMQSLKLAHEFFAEELKNGILPVYCSSWMLYPPHKELFPKGSNLFKFYELFDVFDCKIDESNHNFWRIFNKEFSQNTLRDAPENTALQKNFKSYLLQGNNMGTGRGILLFDGEKIISK